MKGRVRGVLSNCAVLKVYNLEVSQQEGQEGVLGERPSELMLLLFLFSLMF